LTEQAFDILGMPYTAGTRPRPTIQKSGSALNRRVWPGFTPY